MSEENKKQIIEEIEKYYDAVPNISRACSTVIENSIAIFLPLTRIDMSNIYKEFVKNNQTMEISNNLLDKVEIKGRLLGQIHKDILEALLTTKKTFNKTTAQFKIKTTAYKLLKKMGRDTSDKKWLLQKIDEIAECRVKLHYKNKVGKNKTFNFGFLGGIDTTNGKEITIAFSPEYTYFMAYNELLDYSDYVPQIISLRSELKKIQIKLGLKKELSHDFIKAVVRYMLTHSDRSVGTNRKISTLINDLNLPNIIEKEELEDCVTDLKRKEVIALLQRLFGISLISDSNTLNFSGTQEKKRYHIQKTLDF